MRPHHNNLGVILTYAVPTAAALIGLLWLLRRKRGTGEEDDDDDVPSTDSNKPVQKERGITAAPNTLPRERHVVAEKKVESMGRAGLVSSGQGDGISINKTAAQSLSKPSAGVVKSPALAGNVSASGDRSGSASINHVKESVLTSSVFSPSASVFTSAAASSSSSRDPKGSAPAPAVSPTKDPVQVLVRRSEEKLKLDDAAIVQAKLSTSTLQSKSSGVQSSDKQVGSSSSSRESSMAKEIVQEVFARAAQAQTQAAAAAPPAKPSTKVTGDRSGSDSSRDRNDSKGLEPKGASSVGSIRNSVDPSSINTNSNNSSSALASDLQPEVLEAKSQTVLQSGVSAKQNPVGAVMTDRNYSTKLTQEISSYTVNSAAIKDSKDGVAAEANKSLQAKGAVAKEGVSSQDSRDTKDRNSQKSSSNSASSVPAGAKVLPPRKAGGGTAASVVKEGQSDSQTKAVSDQQKSKSVAPSSNSYSSKRRVRSGSGAEEQGDSSQGATENGRLHSSNSPICDTNSEASNDSGHGGSLGETLVPLSGGEVVRYEFNFPSDLCGRLIGRGGKNIQQIKDQSGATVTLTSNPFTPDFQICRVQGIQVEVDRALSLIRKKFPLNQFPLLDMVSLTPAPNPSPVVLPEIMQLNLPEGVSIDIVVSAIVNAGHIFVQQPTHPTFPSLERLNHFMNACYNDQAVPTLPHPVEGGIICAAESEGQWYRAQVVQVYAAQDECDIKYVDYGGYIRVPINTLKQIRSDFMTLPFQAVECYLANITPLQEEEYFSDKASEVLVELTSGKMLQGQVIGRGDDSICYVHLYQVSGHSVVMLNREMVNREVARWIEIL